MPNIPNKPVVQNQEWINGETKLNQTNLTAGVNANITNLKTAVDGVIDALGGPGAEAPGGTKLYLHFIEVRGVVGEDITSIFVNIIGTSSNPFTGIDSYGALTGGMTIGEIASIFVSGQRSHYGIILKGKMFDDSMIDRLGQHPRLPLCYFENGDYHNVTNISFTRDDVVAL